MSLLADLLAKIKPNTSPGGEETSPLLDVPPTLSKPRKIPPKVHVLNSRYGVIAGLVLALIALGAFLAARFGSESPPARAPQAVQPPKGFQTTPFQANQPPPGQPPEAPAATALQSNPARMNLGDATPPAERGGKGISRAERGGKGTGRARHPAGAPHGGTPRSRPAPAPPRQAAAPPRMDTAARDSFLYAARTAERSGDWKSALADYRRAQEIDPGNYKIMSNAAAALNNLGLFAEGAREAERSLGRKPDYVPALINAAIGYSSTGELTKARRLFAAAQGIEPGNRSVALNLGVLLERSGNLDEAVATYRPLAAAGDPLALEGMGRIYERRGKKLDAARTYRQILALPGASPSLKKQVRERLARLEE